ncbi:MAG: response regulator [Nitrososphaerota archaeon]
MSQRKRRILVVDDDSDVALTLKIMLEAYGLDAECFTDPEAALQSFENESYDLVILDIKMPKMNGFQLYAQMKRSDDTIKALFLTALNELHGYDDFKTKVFPKSGERHFIQKPINGMGLYEQIESMLD